MTVDVDDLNRYTYNGEDYDYNTGLQYLRARYYSTGTGNFISQDTYLGNLLNPLSQNRYTYCHNSPVMFDDPSGHMPKWLKATLVVAGAAIAVTAIAAVTVATAGTAAAAAPVIVGALVGAGVSFGTDLAVQATEKKFGQREEIDIYQSIVAGAGGMVTGGFGGTAVGRFGQAVFGGSMGAVQTWATGWVTENKPTAKEYATNSFFGFVGGLISPGAQSKDTLFPGSGKWGLPKKIMRNTGLYFSQNAITKAALRSVFTGIPSQVGYSFVSGYIANRISSAGENNNSNVVCEG